MKIVLKKVKSRSFPPIDEVGRKNASFEYCVKVPLPQLRQLRDANIAYLKGVDKDHYRRKKKEMEYVSTACSKLKLSLSEK